MAAEKNYNAQQLLRQIADRNERAFRTLFDQYKDRLFHYIYGIVKSKEVTEELVMDVFLKIWLGKEVVNQIENFDAFLFRVAYNKSIDFLRKAAKDHQFRDLLWKEGQFANGPSADQQVITREYERVLREALLKLSPQRRLVYHLSREKGFSHLDIARQLQLSKHTISNHIVESQRFIRSYLIRQLDIVALFLVLFFSSL
ncbi:MAG: RNA polymerase sigma-70 factor [Bacteroidetes bacterium]|nr:RNA polymerase sigma-70 factor [Bacteroidota bacterium]